MAQFDDLNDYCLLEVLDLLSPNGLFSMFRVNRRLKQLATEKMRTKIKAITLGHLNSFCMCSHLGAISQDQLLNVNPMFEKQNVSDALQDPSTRARFLDVLTICAGIKCIDLSYSLPDGFLMEVVKFCPEIECLKFEKVKKEELDQVMNQIGHRLVHVGKIGYEEEQKEARLIAIVAKKCPNIKQLDLDSINNLNYDLVAAFKLLNKSCWIKLRCKEPNFFDDVIDELEVDNLDFWFLSVSRFDRLSSLKIRFGFYGMNNYIDFTNLKKLEYNPKHYSYIEDNHDLLSYFFLIRFPRLEEFCFNASRGLTEDDYNKLFHRMRSVKKLIITCDWIADVNEHLPGSSILQLNELENIDVKIWFLGDWKPDMFLMQLEQYVDDIQSLKKLSVEFVCGENYEWKKTVENELKRMKMEQNRVKVDLIK